MCLQKYNGVSLLSRALPPAAATRPRGFPTSPLLAGEAQALISSPGSIVDHANHNQRIDGNICVYGGLEQDAGRCLVSVPSPAASAHSLPIRVIAFSQRDSLRGTGPWSLHISLMPRSVELFLTPSSSLAQQPARQTDRHVHTHTLANRHTHTHTLPGLIILKLRNAK